METPHIKSVEITSTAMKKRIKKRKLQFKPGPNVIIGPNGSGKSSLLEVIMDFEKKRTSDCIITFIPGTYYAFDFEKQNPRKSQHFTTGLDIYSRFLSHGESNKAIIGMLKGGEAKDAMFFLDEPEQALDIDGIEQLLSIVETSESSQILIVTHHPHIITHPMFNVVELEKGYYQKVINSVIDLCSRIEEM